MSEEHCPASLCTVADSQYKDELVLMLTSFRQHHRVPAYVVCDPTTADHLRAAFGDGGVHLLPIIDPRRTAVLRGGLGSHPAYDAAYRDMVRDKTVAIEAALSHHASTLYADCDVTFLEPVGDIFSEGADITLSEHDIDAGAVVLNGRFNAGYVGVRNQAFAPWWRKAQKYGEFYDQKCLDDARQGFSIELFPSTHNFGWWRGFCDGLRGRERLASFEFRDGAIRVGGEPIISVQTHLLAACWSPGAHARIDAFNTIFLACLAASTVPAHCELLAFIENKAARV